MSGVQGLDDIFDTESIDDVTFNLNNDTESIGEKSNLSFDWSNWSNWTCETEPTVTTSTSLKPGNMDKIRTIKVE